MPTRRNRRRLRNLHNRVNRPALYKLKPGIFYDRYTDSILSQAYTEKMTKIRDMNKYINIKIREKVDFKIYIPFNEHIVKLYEYILIAHDPEYPNQLTNYKIETYINYNKELIPNKLKRKSKHVLFDHQFREVDVCYVE